MLDRSKYARTCTVYTTGYKYRKGPFSAPKGYEFYLSVSYFCIPLFIASSCRLLNSLIYVLWLALSIRMQAQANEKYHARGVLQLSIKKVSPIWFFFKQNSRNFPVEVNNTSFGRKIIPMGIILKSVIIYDEK